MSKRGPNKGIRQKRRTMENRITELTARIARLEARIPEQEKEIELANRRHKANILLLQELVRMRARLTERQVKTIGPHRTTGEHPALPDVVVEQLKQREDGQTSLQLTPELLRVVEISDISDL